MALNPAMLSIGEVASRVGLRPSAIRYYEEIELVRPAARVSGQRRYEPSTLEQLRLIRFCQGLGFSLAEMRQLVTPPIMSTSVTPPPHEATRRRRSPLA